MKIAISPCPNDTYLFHAWIAGIVDHPPEVTFADIQHLNELALIGHHTLIKVSFSCLKEILGTYELLPIGSALGFNCGPKLLSKHPFSIEELPNKTVAIPGALTTAHLLLDRLLPQPKSKHFCLYHEVVDLLNRGVVDCGLIIHETRFTFVEQGFHEIVDLGELWHKRHALPLPLGCLAIRRDYPNKGKVVQTLRNSLKIAKSNPEASRAFILEHAQEKNPSVIERHIATYVNQETEALSEEGLRAIEILINRALPMHG